MATIDSSDWYTLTPDQFAQSVAAEKPDNFTSLVTRALVLDGPTITANGRPLNGAQIQSVLTARGITATTAEIAEATTILRNARLFERTVGATRNFYILAKFTGAPYSQGAQIPSAQAAGQTTPNNVVTVQGPQGLTGATGAQGPAGPAGPQGEPGPAGPSVTLSNDTPQPTGNATSGGSAEAARIDHVHELENHAPAHEAGGSDAIEVANLGTTETTTDRVLAPDGSNGVQWVAPPRSYLNLSRIPTDGDVVECWDFDQTSPGVINYTGKVASKVLVEDGSFRRATCMVGNLTGISPFNTGGFPGTQALRLADQDFNIPGDITIECLITWNGSGSAGAQIVGFFGNGETEATNNIWQIINHAGDGGGIGVAWERGAGINEVHDLRVEPNGDSPYLLTVVRDTTANTITVYINGVALGVASYTNGNEPTGGTSAELVVFRDDLEQLSCAGLCISDIARSAANVLARAQAVGVAA